MPIIEVVQRIEVPDIPDIDLPYDDGEPLESDWHRLQINLLGDMLHQHWPERTDFFAGGNMFVYYSLEQACTRDYKGPDFFVVLGVDGTRPRQSWIVWQEEGRYPDVVVELLSPTTIAQDTVAWLDSLNRGCSGSRLAYLPAPHHPPYGSVSLDQAGGYRRYTSD